MTTQERKDKRRAQLAGGDVSRLAALDDFESLVRMQERSALARALRGAGMAGLADEIEAMNERRPAWA